LYLLFFITFSLRNLLYKYIVLYILGFVQYFKKLYLFVI
jgi:hypothetical protein